MEHRFITDIGSVRAPENKLGVGSSAIDPCFIRGFVQKLWGWQDGAFAKTVPPFP
jgi:hypothetical protein